MSTVSKRTDVMSRNASWFSIGMSCPRSRDNTHVHERAVRQGCVRSALALALRPTESTRLRKDSAIMQAEAVIMPPD